MKRRGLSRRLAKHLENTCNSHPHTLPPRISDRRDRAAGLRRLLQLDDRKMLAARQVADAKLQTKPAPPSNASLRRCTLWDRNLRGTKPEAG